MKNTARIAVLILALITVLGGCGNKAPVKPIDTSWTMSSDSYSLTREQFTFFYNMVVAASSGYSEQMGYSTDIPLSEQECAMGDKAGYTWHDHYVDSTVEKISELLTLCEAAKAAGVSLDESERAEVDKNIANLHSAAEKNGMSVDEMIEENYGAGVTEDDMRFCLELQRLSLKMNEYTRENLTYTDEQILEECRKNALNYYRCDYRYYVVRVATEPGATVEEIEAAKTVAKETADKLVLAANEQEYTDIIEDYCREQLGLSDKDIEVTLSATLKEGYGYSSAGAMAQWLFEADEEGDFLREDSQTKAYYNENGGVYGVCFIVSAPSLNESIIKDSRHILFRVNNEGGMTDEEAKKKAEELLATLNEGGLTEEEFAEAAKEHSTDYGSAPKGGLIEGAAKESLYEEYGDWLFAEDRKTGDVGLVKTEVGYHLVFCVSENVKWKEDIESALRGREFNEAYEEYRKANAIKVNEPCLTTIESA